MKAKRLAPLAAALCASFGAHAQTTPIANVIVIFQENVSFDHYFGTYPNAQNNAGETPFYAAQNTPSVNGLSPELLNNNPNRNASGTQINPTRFGPSQAYTCSMNHNYEPEQKAVDGGLMDGFVVNTGSTSEGCATDGSTVMAYFDGNTVTAMWNYAQYFAMSDNAFGSTFGPSTTGVVNLVSGQTGNGILHWATSNSSVYVPAGSSTTQPVSGVTDIGDLDAYLDDCGNDKGGTVTTTATLEMTSKNIGDLLNAANVTWGWFQGGFTPTQAAVYNSATNTWTPAVCGQAHITHEYTSTNYNSWAGAPTTSTVVPNPTLHYTSDIHTSGNDYVSHHAGFQYYASTRNPHHLPPTGTIGTTDQANHNYDLTYFFQALQNGQLPSVSFLKAPYYQNGHPGNSDPTMEQVWLTQVINAVQQSEYWNNTVIIITYDDSDGWYDHVNGPLTSTSNTTDDALAGTGNCGTPSSGAIPARCGHGPRLPLLVISPWAQENYVDHGVNDQTSVIAFIEYNWGLGNIDGGTAANGRGAFDQNAGSLLPLFNFSQPPGSYHVILNQNGTVSSVY
jgi:phospholipase C